MFKNQSKFTGAVLFSLLLIFLFASFAFSANLENIQTAKIADYSTVHSKAVFTPNLGQWPDQVLMRGEIEGEIIWVCSDGIYFQLIKTTPPDMDPSNSEPVDMSPKFEQTIVKMTFENSNHAHEFIGMQEYPWKSNYFLGKDASRWKTDVTSYSSATIKNIYDGIDMHYYGMGSNLEYDYIIAPGADPSQIKFTIEGQDAVNVNESGEMIIETVLGTLSIKPPNAFQKIENQTKQVNCTFTQISENTYSFQIDREYDRDNELIIDPVMEYSTYIGGTSSEWGYGIAVDNNHCAYIVGETGSVDFPVQNEYQTVQTVQDVFVTKFNVDGNTLEYSTYIGGSAGDFGRGIAVDDIGRAYITGMTYSNDFPIYSFGTPFQATNKGTDGFITKLGPAGNTLEFSTYVGGTGEDHPAAIAIDDIGDAYITGKTNSTDFPVLNAYQTTKNNGYDAFVFKIDAFGTVALYSTYLGGNNEDYGDGIAVDIYRAAYVAGETRSTNFPLQYPVQTSNGGYTDAFITKINPHGNILDFSSYLGGLDDDFGRDVDVDRFNNAYVTGYTTSFNFPLKNAFQPTLLGQDAFVTKINTAAGSLVYSSFIGTIRNNLGWGIAVDKAGNPYICGYTDTPDFPTVNPLYSYNGLMDIFLVKIRDSGPAITFSTHIGGSENEHGLAIAVDDNYCMYVTGVTYSLDFPTVDPYQSGIGNTDGTSDAFLLKVCDVCLADGDVDNNGTLLSLSDLDSLQLFLSNTGYVPAELWHSDLNGDCSIDQKDLDLFECYFTYGLTCFDAYPVPTCCEPNIRYGACCLGLDCNLYTETNCTDYGMIFWGQGTSCDPSPCTSCCIGMAGDVNCENGDTPDISDIVRLIDYLYLSKDPLCCAAEAETNGDCGAEPDISDIVRIIDFLYLPTHTPPVACDHCTE